MPALMWGYTERSLLELFISVVAINQRVGGLRKYVVKGADNPVVLLVQAKVVRYVMFVRLQVIITADEYLGVGGPVPGVQGCYPPPVFGENNGA